ncbi:MAG: hypothetical protein ACM3Q1_06920 [Bacteroidales bacterium]
MKRGVRPWLGALAGGLIALQMAPAATLAAEQLAQLLDVRTRADQDRRTLSADSGEARARTPNLLSAPRRAGNEVGEVDSSGSWYHLRRHDAPAAQAELERLKAEHPEWTPPDDLLRALTREQLRAAMAAGRSAEAQRLAATLPAASPCEQPDIAWSVADGKALLDMARRCPQPGIASASMDRYLARLPTRERDDSATALLRESWPPAVRERLQRAALAGALRRLSDGTLPAADQASLRAQVEQLRDAGGAEALGWHDLASQQPDAARGWFSKSRAWGGGPSADEGLARALLAAGDIAGAQAMAQGKPALRPALADAHLAQALAAADAGQPFDALAGDVHAAVALGRADAWENLGWRLMDRQRPDDAAQAFAQAPAGEGTLYGRVLAEQARGDLAVAETVACDHRSISSRLATACVDSIAARQLRAYEAQDYDSARALGERLGDIAPDHRGGRVLTAWSCLRTGHADQAADAFARLYDETPTPDLAQALAQSLEKAGRTNELEARVAAGDTLLLRETSRKAAATAWGRKQFDLAGRHYSAVKP